MDKNGILIGLSESEKTKFGKEDSARQSLPQKVFSAIWAVESEVNNGGFSQYFSNSGGESLLRSSWKLSKLLALQKPLASVSVLSPLHFLLDYPGRRKRFGRLRPISQMKYLRSWSL